MAVKSRNLLNLNKYFLTNCFDQITKNRTEQRVYTKNFHFSPHNAFISRHFSKSSQLIQFESGVLPATLMKAFLRSQKITFEQGYTCLVLNCILCPHSSVRRNGKLYINLVTGMFLCHSCRVTGTWSEFKEYVTVFKRDHKLEKHQLKHKPSPEWMISDEEIEKIKNLLSDTTPLFLLDEEKSLDLKKQFKLEEINQLTAKKFNIRTSKEMDRIFFPIYGVNGEIVAVRQRKVKNDKIEEKVLPKPAANMLFGLQKITPNIKKIILTKHPLDTLILSQELHKHSLSLPKGISCLPIELLPILEQFESITFWFGADVKSWEASRSFAKKLGEVRCHLIRPEAENLCPYEAKQQNLDLAAILKAVHPVGHKSITDFQKLRSEVSDDMSHVDKLAGVKWQRFPHLNKLLKGHRRGELTVLTGPTGSGKTTLISEYSLDLCMQGVNTLWGSFEIKNTRLARLMLIQFAQLPLEDHMELFDKYADEFENFPLHFMTFHGEESIGNVLSTMRHAVYVHDIHHVILDNLQFMMGMKETSSPFDRFYRQDLILALFRKFATSNNVHVTLVIHPRKEKEGELYIDSIFGSAKASQEADNILILQDKRLQSLKGKKYLQVAKNRFTGDIGIVPLEFNKETLSFSIKKPKKVAEKKVKRESDLTVDQIPEINGLK